MNAEEIYQLFYREVLKMLPMTKDPKDPKDLTQEEAMAVCIGAGVAMTFVTGDNGALSIQMANPVGIALINGRYQVFEQHPSNWP